jgi:Kef-type K+ transport system membrane component KefB
MSSSIFPAWPPNFFDILPHLALALLIATLCGALGARLLGVPRVTGYVAAGLLLGPMGFGWFAPDDLKNLRTIIDLALALILFELGVHTNVRWFRANPMLLASSVLEAVLAFLAVMAAMRLLGYAWSLAAAVAGISMATAPAVVMRVSIEERSAGQVTQRMLVFSALGVIYAVVFTHMVAGAMHGLYGGELLVALLYPVYLLGGSLAVGGLLAAGFFGLRQSFSLSDEQGVALLFGLLMVAVAITQYLKLPPLLAPLVAGIIVRYRDPRPHLWPRHFGTAGGLLLILMFVLTGISPTMAEFVSGIAVALLLIALRALGKFAGVMLLAPASGINTRQAIALGAALTPLSAVAFVLASDLYAMVPGAGRSLMAIVSTMIAILGVFGPIVTQRALRWSGESGNDPSEGRLS